MIEVITLVAELSGFGKDEEAMSKAARDVE